MSTYFARLSLLVLIGLASSGPAAASVIITTDLGIGIPTPNYNDFLNNATHVHFQTARLRLYRPSGSTPWDQFGLEGASVRFELNADIDTTLTPIAFDGSDAMYAELDAQVRILGGREGYDLKLPFLSAVVFSPSHNGTKVLFWPIEESGALPTLRHVWLRHTPPAELGEYAAGLQLSVEGGYSEYEYDFQKVVEQPNLRVLAQIVETNRVQSYSDVSGWRVIVDSSRTGAFGRGQTYLANRGIPSSTAMSVFFSSTVPEPTTFASALAASLLTATRLRIRQA